VHDGLREPDAGVDALDGHGSSAGGCSPAGPVALPDATRR
jgi:hypothetical protein